MNENESQAFIELTNLLEFFKSELKTSLNRLTDFQVKADYFNFENQPKLSPENKRSYELLTNLTKYTFESDIWNGLLIKLLFKLIDLQAKVTSDMYVVIVENLKPQIKELQSSAYKSDQHKIETIGLLQNELNK